jgi:polysaccharide biosynthesis protein PelA
MIVTGRAIVSAVVLARAAKARTRDLRPGASWVIYYGANADPETLSRYDVIILDPAFQGSIKDCAVHGAKTFGYLSLGEFAKAGKFVSLPSGSAMLLEENPNWPGSYRVDVRRSAWQSLISHDVVPRLLARGFDGLFLDTLDTPAHLEETDPKRYHGMRAAAVSLVKVIRRRFPATPIIMNRGYALLPEVTNAIDGIVAESFMTTYDFATRSYKWVEPEVVARQRTLLRPAQQRHPPLPILSLDYWDPKEPDTIRKIYEQERNLGHLPYVATILLDQILHEPRG